MVRLIDANAFKKENERLLHCDFPYLSETTLEELIDEAPTIGIEPHWIPCSERLPEENRTVIASTEYGVFPEARYTKEDGWEWAYESGADYWEKIAEVKAWMPLPKPYEGEGR